jgi:aminoglycoside 3-N-acetyltransferase
VSEEEAIARVDRPATVASLVADLRSLGVTAGMTVMVHSSLSRLGYVAGGAQAVVQALLEAVGTDGTIMMPTHSGDLTDPAPWTSPPIPAAWWDIVRNEMPAFDIRLTPTRGMGAIVECFRHVRGVRRSAHPTVSAAAVGPNAEALMPAITWRTAWARRHRRPGCMTSTATSCC